MCTLVLQTFNKKVNDPLYLSDLISVYLKLDESTMKD